MHHNMQSGANIIFVHQTELGLSQEYQATCMLTYAFFYITGAIVSIKIDSWTSSRGKIFIGTVVNSIGALIFTVKVFP